MLDRAAAADLDAIWVGRDLGYRGGRRTGLALTDDIHFTHHLERWDLEPSRPTYGEPIAERTAKVIWDVLVKTETPIFLWNVFPLHPHKEGDPFSNRTHNARERKAGSELLIKIINYIAPRQIIAIGNDAFNTLTSLFTESRVYKARHPSYGGQNDFLNTMHALYSDCIVTPESDLFKISK
jgi:uracil-DNA glycosylase